MLPAGTIVNTTLGSASSTTPGSPTAVDGSPVASPEASPVASMDDTAAEGPVFQTIISGSDLKDAYRATGPLGQVVVGFELNGDAADRFYDFTSQNIGRPMSIVIDKTVISSPVINGAISDQANRGHRSGRCR
ncbi:MAG: hypothetical protein R2848_18445 [Thermomicrobiales bacterium]